VDGSERAPGIDIQTVAGPMKVGRDTLLTLNVAAPSGQPIAIVQGLPAGAVVDPQSLAAMSDRVTRYAVLPDRIELVTRPFAPGEAMTLPIVVQPAFAGRYSTIPLQIGPVAGQKTEIAPLIWAVAP
jgi:hypothetical protein